MSKAIPEPITKLIQSLSRLPGIGPKTASRLAYFMLRAPDDVVDNLVSALQNVKANTMFCSTCWNITSSNPCPICTDDERDQHTLAVVEEPMDLLAIERTGIYRGMYHVLHGSISPVNGIGPDNLKIRELVSRVAHQNIVEVIIATNPGLEGDATAMYIQRELNRTPVKVTRLARGLPTGGDIEYVDTVTLSRALQGRSEL
ncbi:MAG: recombination mediator RecR [Phototrophicaceae bacterium]